MKASSESGECASLIATGSFSVFGAVCGPGMGVSVSFSGATEVVASPWLGPSQRDFPAEERVYRRRTEDSVRVAGACLALGRAISCQREPSILVPGEQLAGAKDAKEEWDMEGIPKAKAKRPCGRWRRRRRPGRQGRVARISAVT